MAAAATPEKSTKLWGGRFSRDTDVVLAKWIESVTVDSHLVQEDIWGSIAHVTMLGRQVCGCVCVCVCVCMAGSEILWGWAGARNARVVVCEFRVEDKPPARSLSPPRASSLRRRLQPSSAHWMA
jgi:hypothetical protein